jgi:putative ABC transport system ATP-binding protein
MRCVGYRQAWEALDGDYPLAELRDGHLRHAPAGQAPAHLAARHAAAPCVIACDAPDALAAGAGPRDCKHKMLQPAGPRSGQTLRRRAVVFRDVTLDVAPGEFVAIVGESGVGKSTLLNCMAGLDTGTRARCGSTARTWAAQTTSARCCAASQVGFVFQAFHVLPHLDVAQNVALPLLLLERPDARRVEAMLEAVGLAGLGGRLPQQLSGGQLQRVAIARALVHQPSLLLADEPTGNLDPAPPPGDGRADCADARARRGAGAGHALGSRRRARRPLSGTPTLRMVQPENHGGVNAAPENRARTPTMLGTA